MTRIDTEIPEVIVEIEDKEYTVAPRTVEIMDKLIEVGKDYAGKPNYRLWMAELEVLLGKKACHELFTGGKSENVDRLQMIYSGVVRAFQHTDEEISAQTRERAAESIATALAPLNEFLKRVNDVNNKNTTGRVREIPRS